MALLLTSVFGVTGCGSDDDVEVESRVKNAAPASEGTPDIGDLSEATCGYLDNYGSSYSVDLRDLRDLRDRLDLGDVRNLRKFVGNMDAETFWFELLNPVEQGELRAVLSDLDMELRRLSDRLDFFDQCDATLDVRTDSVTTTAVPPAPATSGVSDDPSKADCDLLDRLGLRDLRDLDDLLDTLERLDLRDFRDFRDLLDLDDPLGDLYDDVDIDVRDHLDFRTVRDRIRDILDQCDAASKSGATAPEGDDVDGS
jgi:hypothetical protein